MTRIIILFAFVSFSLLSTAQKYSADLLKSYSALLKSYSANELAGFDKGTIEILEFAIDNAVYFTPIPQGKDVKLTEVEVNTESVKFTDLGLKIQDNTQYFRVKGTSMMLVVKSFTILKLQLNKH
jgi:hypothetical protein